MVSGRPPCCHRTRSPGFPLWGSVSKGAAPLGGELAQRNAPLHSAANLVLNSTQQQGTTVLDDLDTLSTVYAAEQAAPAHVVGARAVSVPQRAQTGNQSGRARPAGSGFPQAPCVQGREPRVTSPALLVEHGNFPSYDAGPAGHRGARAQGCVPRAQEAPTETAAGQLALATAWACLHLQEVGRAGGI